jgi:hypothetical protein
MEMFMPGYWGMTELRYVARIADEDTPRRDGQSTGGWGVHGRNSSKGDRDSVKPFKWGSAMGQLPENCPTHPRCVDEIGLSC